jgi:hypothetical protein
MLPGAIGLICAMLLLLNGFSALRRPLNALVEHDPIGRRLLTRGGEGVALRVYRIYGAAFVIAGMVVAYLSLGLLQTQSP